MPIVAGVIPVASFAQTKRICDLCDASIPPRLEAAFAAAGGDERAEFELGIAYAAQQCAELLLAGAPGIHFYALNRAPATRAVLGALRASRPWERGAGVDGHLDRRLTRLLVRNGESQGRRAGTAAPGARRTAKSRTTSSERNRLMLGYGARRR